MSIPSELQAHQILPEKTEQGLASQREFKFSRKQPRQVGLYCLFFIIAGTKGVLMSNYLTRKKTLMGKRYEVEVPLAQYGGASVKISCHT